MACANRIFEFIEQDEEQKENTVLLENVTGEIDIENVDFCYDMKHPLIENFDLHVNPGMMIALVGPTGCGKTTFINLLMRFYDVNKGKILVNGTNIQDVTRHSLRESFGMVLQETWIKEGTVRENLCFGKVNASEEELIEACKQAHSWSFIKRLPHQLDTYLYEDSLSQGQKQLLCITRVLLKKPEMLILDEATSSIDTRTEIQIQKSL